MQKEHTAPTQNYSPWSGCVSSNVFRIVASVAEPSAAKATPLANRRWTTAILDAVGRELSEIAAWLDLLLHPVASLRELLSEPRPLTIQPLESIPILASSLLDDHARCLAILSADVTQPLSDTQRAELRANHERMAWVLRTYFA
ncbi:hypothetical protein [Hymenobacter sp. YC55]|uniref:hypothetical protein n=1 Tax=Hymenobacter sp. YC55 TaxID=3034019 RepID=UPI0023F88123|nr:hypothetical protein [Hymenobacter sp. YC55]MDF7811561.1 hypothetical protein [Hymenobacter sp. YC55]